jgi:hypothetical protein
VWELTVDIARGVEPDGISYCCYYEEPNWVVVVTHPDGRKITERFHQTYAPVCGPDVVDTARAEEVMERLIAQTRSDGVLRELVNKARAIAAPVGPQHALWDVISDAEAILQGQKPIVPRSDVEATLRKHCGQEKT